MHHQNAKLFPEVSLTLNKDWGVETGRWRKSRKLKGKAGKSTKKHLNHQRGWWHKPIAASRGWDAHSKW